jgi:hypothetical protein
MIGSERLKGCVCFAAEGLSGAREERSRHMANDSIAGMETLGTANSLM